MRLSKKERAQVLRAVDYGWYSDIDLAREIINCLPWPLNQLAWDVLTVLDNEPWRNFSDVLNEVLDY